VIEVASDIRTQDAYRAAHEARAAAVRDFWSWIKGGKTSQ